MSSKKRVTNLHWGLRRGLLSGLLSTTSGVIEAPAGGWLLAEVLALFTLWANVSVSLRKQKWIKTSDPIRGNGNDSKERRTYSSSVSSSSTSFLFLSGLRGPRSKGNSTSSSESTLAGGGEEGGGVCARPDEEGDVVFFFSAAFVRLSWPSCGAHTPPGSIKAARPYRAGPAHWSQPAAGLALFPWLASSPPPCPPAPPTTRQPRLRRAEIQCRRC